MNGLQVKELRQLPTIAAGYIFNTPEFQSLKTGVTRYFVLFESEQAIARICFSIDNNSAISGLQATFGSIDGENHIPVKAAKYFLDQVCEQLKSSGIKEIIIKHWPDCYSENNYIHEIFAELGFKVTTSEINQHLVVEEADFKLLIRKNERKKLNQCLNKGYTFRHLSMAQLKDVYQLVTQTRERKGYPVSMAFDLLEKTMSSLPDNYLLFGLFDKEELIAASVSIRISENILYNFYHADEISYRSTSPLVMLVEEIYRYCQQNGIKILDLGVSSEKGIKNEGLFVFKENLGCLTSKKNTYFLSYG